MKKLDRKYYPGKDYRELFSVMIDANKCEDTAVGITNEGELLYIESKLMNNSSAYWMQSVFFSIDKEEFRAFLEQAKSRDYLAKAIKNRQTTEEELGRLSQ